MSSSEKTDVNVAHPAPYDLYDCPDKPPVYHNNDEDKTLGEEISTFLDYTTTHGIPHIKRVGNWFNKLFWFLASAGCFGYVLYQVYLLGIKYSNNEYDVYIDVVFSRKIPFPAVTICNLNPLRKSALIEYAGEDEDLRKLLVQAGWVDIEDHFPKPPGGEAEKPEEQDGTTDGTADGTGGGTVGPDEPIDGTGDGTADGSKDGTGGGTVGPIDGTTDGPIEGSNDGTKDGTGRKRKKRETSPPSTPRPESGDNKWTPETDPKREVETLLLDAVQSWPVDQKTKVGHDIDLMLLDCTLAGLTCSSSNFTWMYNYLYGNCYTFNIYGDFNTSRPGPYYGLELELFVELDEYVPQIQESLGFRVVVHDQSQVPFPEDQGFNISPGFHSVLGVRKFVVERLGDEYYPCWPTDTDGEQNIYAYTNPNSYSYGVCLRSCYQSKLIQTCQCGDAQYPFETPAFPENTTVCKTQAQKNCKERMWSDYLDGALSCNCTQACTDTQFIGTVSSSIWPLENQEYKESMVVDYVGPGSSASLRRALLAGGETPADQAKTLQYNIAKFSVYYEDLNYEYIYQKPSYTSTNLMSDIGGQLGLWIGMSILTIGEYLELACKLIINLCSCNSKVKPQPKV